MFEGEPPASPGDADTSQRAKDLQVCLSRRRQFQSSTISTGSSRVYEYDLWVKPEVLGRPADESGLIIAIALYGFRVCREGYEGGVDATACSPALIPREQWRRLLLRTLLCTP